jgi:hypothetical protein
MTLHARHDTPALSVWRIPLIILGLLLALTNIVDLAPSLRPAFWSNTGTLGLVGTEEHNKFVVREIDPGASDVIKTIQPDDRVSWVGPNLISTPNVLMISHLLDRGLEVTLEVEHAGSTRRIVAKPSVPPDQSIVLSYYSQIVIDLVFSLVGILLIVRRSSDKAVRALAIAMICWSSAVPMAATGLAGDALFVINQLTARMWTYLMLVYWAINLVSTGRWGVSKAINYAWLPWTVISIAVGILQSGLFYLPGTIEPYPVKVLVEGNRLLMYIVTLIALAEGVVSTKGEERSRLKWGLFVFSIYFLLILLRFATNIGDTNAFEGGMAILGADYTLQLVFPLGLLYATLRHRLLDVGLVVNRTLAFSVTSLSLILVFFLVERAAHHLLHFEDAGQSALFDGAVAFTLFFTFNRLHHRVDHWIEHLFFHQWRVNADTLKRFLGQAAHYTEPEALLTALGAELDRFTGGAGYALYQVGANKALCKVGGSLHHAAATIGANDEVAVTLRATGQPVYLADLRSPIDAECALPMMQGGKLTGLTLLGAKPSGQSYRPDEIEALSFAVTQVGLDLFALRVLSLESENRALVQQAAAREEKVAVVLREADEMRILVKEIGVLRYATRPSL